MGFWPFSGSKKQRVAEPAKHARERSLQSNPSEKTNRLEKSGTEISGNTKSSAQQEPGEKGHQLSRTRLPGSQQQLRSQTEPIQRSASRRLSQPVPPFSEKALYQHDPVSESSLGPETFNVVRQSPRLTARKSEQDSGFARRKSSKRKAEDYAREREIRAMSSSSPIPIPRRPTSFYDRGPLQRETRDVPGPFSRKSTRPASQVSLPLPEALSDAYAYDAPYSNSFKIGMFAALSPRPTIKYDANPKQARGKQPQRPKPVIRPSTVEEETDADKKRIDDLADDLDAGGLRELMERDRRRRERKRKDDQVRLQRKLERRAERQREEDARKARTEEYVSASASRVQGLGLDSLADPGSAAGPSRTRSNPFSDSKAQPASPVVIRNPFEDAKELEAQDPGSNAEPELVIPVRSPLRKIQTDMTKIDDRPVPGTLSPPRSPVPRTGDRQSMSQASLLHREATADLPESASFTGAASDHSSQRLSSWTAFFRRGTRRKLSSSFQGRSTPSEFSNTSRESFARKQPPVVAPRTFRRPDSTTPQRTMSKFREDLPEFPVSPPDSRMQSPETGAPPLTGAFNQTVTVARADEMVEDEAEPITTATSKPISAGPVRPENRPSMEPDSTLDIKQEMLLSQSLASVDSEASWLSGKPRNRRSGASQRLQPSRSSLTRPMPGAFDGALPLGSPLEGPSLADPDPTPPRGSEEKDETWHVGVGRQPTVVRQASRAKSREGLLKDYIAADRKESDSASDDGDDGDDESPGTGNEESEPAVALGRARSVEYRGGHARQISAGSARLLDIRRSSTHSADLLRTSSLSRDKFTETSNRSSVGF